MRSPLSFIHNIPLFAGTFFVRCFLFSLLWSLTTYLHVLSLKILGATEVASLLATSVSFVYLMAWVVLHEEFVGTRVSARRSAAGEEVA